MAQDALERLMNSNVNQEPRYSVEEQMDSVEDDDFLESMSNDSRSALLKTIQEVTIDEPVETTNTVNTETTNTEAVTEPTMTFKPVSTEPVPEVVNENKSSDDSTTIYSTPMEVSNVESNEVLSNYNSSEKKVRKPRGRVAKPKQTSEQVVPVMTTKNTTTFDPIMNQLAVNLIADLQTKKFKMNGFDDNLMQIVFDYMRTKFM